MTRLIEFYPNILACSPKIRNNKQVKSFLSFDIIIAVQNSSVMYVQCVSNGIIISYFETGHCGTSTMQPSNFTGCILFSIENTIAAGLEAMSAILNPLSDLSIS